MWQYSIQKDPLIWKRHSKTKNKQAFRTSRSQMFYKIGVFENFAKFTGKYLPWSRILIKLYALRDSNTNVFLGFLWNFQEHLIMKHLTQQKSLWLIYINYHTADEIITKKIRRNHTRAAWTLQNSWRARFSAYLLC